MEHLDAVVFFIGCMFSHDLSKIADAYIQKINGQTYTRKELSSSVGWFIFIVTILLIIF